MYQIQLHSNRISTKTTNTGTLQGRYQRVMNVASLQTPGSVKDIFPKTRNKNSIINEIDHVIYSCYNINEQIKHKIEILGKINNQSTLLLLDTEASVTVIDKKTTLLDNIKPIKDIYLETGSGSR
ncbi:Uncharacterized protein FWK35_00033489 [Aphis craccivora]|uniref:Uncharacterized protein n=1 Tax=Aphis craccivora TaxID=307492 RepID=A0A6G0VKA9_APHCR|nr:Uncharacterized protein FWK35_00033489 [Aphis craccivora]